MKRITLILILCLIAFTFKISAQIKVNSSGYVGINNTNPTYRLDVNGDLKLVTSGGNVLTPQIAGHNLKNKLGLIKFGNNDNRKKKIYT